MKFESNFTKYGLWSEAFTERIREFLIEFIFLFGINMVLSSQYFPASRRISSSAYSLAKLVICFVITTLSFIFLQIEKISLEFGLCIFQ